jgi:hypothetical protein
MMLIPNASATIIAEEKLRGYVLMPEHVRGGDKSAFLMRLGYNREHWQLLEEALRTQHLTLDAREEGSTEWGRMFVIEGPITGPNGRQRMVRSVWIIRHGEENPRFVTVYPI